MTSPWGLIPNASVKVDRKSTRLNSSHTVISYAVFCLKKKKMHHDLNHDLRHWVQRDIVDSINLSLAHADPQTLAELLHLRERMPRVPHHALADTQMLASI